MKIADTFIHLKQVVMTSSGTCLFLGNDQKTFIIYVDPVMGEQIRFASSKQAPSRPLTFDFMRYLLFGLDVSVRHIVLYRAEKETCNAASFGTDCRAPASSVPKNTRFLSCSVRTKT